MRRFIRVRTIPAIAVASDGIWRNPIFLERLSLRFISNLKEGLGIWKHFSRTAHAQNLAYLKDRTFQRKAFWCDLLLSRSHMVEPHSVIRI